MSKTKKVKQTKAKSLAKKEISKETILYRKTYQAINYKFNKKIKPEIESFKLIVKKGNPKITSDALKKTLQLQRDYLRTITQTGTKSGSFFKQFKDIEKYRNEGNFEKLQNIYRGYSIKEQKKTFISNLNTAFDKMIYVNEDLKEKVRDKINKLSVNKLKKYDTLIDDIFQNYDDENMTEELESILVEILTT